MGEHILVWGDYWNFADEDRHDGTFCREVYKCLGCGKVAEKDCIDCDCCADFAVYELKRLADGSGETVPATIEHVEQVKSDG